MPEPGETLFTLEAVFAKKGDALILHYGQADDPSMLLIDGGPRGVYNRFLRPRLDQLRLELGVDEDRGLPFRMAMVSHIDDDHVAGVIDLFEDLDEARDRGRPPPYEVDVLWHNSFDDIVGNEHQEIVSRLMEAAEGSADADGIALPAGIRGDARAVVASTRQGRTLRNLARKLGVTVNHPFEGLVTAPSDALPLGHGLSLRVLGPLSAQVDAYVEQWNDDLEALGLDADASAHATAFRDANPFNLASIAVLAELDGRSMLLTGDARGDFLMEGLEAAGLLTDDAPLHVDLLKVPHHGSRHNVETDFFRRVTADHYVLSGNGDHGNPHRDMLDMLQEARDGDAYTVHFTVTEDASQHETNQKRKKALQAVAAWVAQLGPEVRVVFRSPDHDRMSVHVDLLDPLYPDEAP